MYVCMCVCSPIGRPVEGIRSPGVEVTGCRELCPTGAGSRTLVHFTSPRRDPGFFHSQNPGLCENPRWAEQDRNTQQQLCQTLGMRL